MKKEYLKPIKTDDNSKTLKYIKALYKTVDENPIQFQNNEQIKRIIKNNKHN